MFKLSSLIICLVVLGCATRPDTAPIENATNIPGYLAPPTAAKPVTATPSSAVAQTSAGNTTSMAALSDNSNSVKALPVAAKTSPAMTNNSVGATNSSMNLVPDTSATSGWMIPTAGKSDGYRAGSKGIDIYGSEGQSVLAANSGKVVYSGNGLKGYGNLIIIKHDDTYLTAYAHNKTNLVKEGVNVRRGQKIAEMGTDDSGRAVLHFELRKNGKPIDPFNLIKSN